MSVQLCSGIGQYEYTKVEIWPHIKRVFSIETNLYLKNWFQIFEQKFHFFCSQHRTARCVDTKGMAMVVNSTGGKTKTDRHTIDPYAKLGDKTG